MNLKLESTTTELRKGWNLAWYHHLTHIASVQKSRGLQQKLDALRVQTGPSLSKYEGFRRKLICFKGISSFLTYFNWRLFLHRTCNIKTTYWNFNPFWLHLLFFMHFMIYFEVNDLEIGKGYNLNSEKVETWHGIIIWPT